MKLVTAITAAIFVLGISASASAAEITLLSPNPIKETIDKLVADYEAKSGNHVTVTYGTGVSTRDTVAKGGAKDVTLLFAPFDEAIRTGNVDRGSQTVVATLRLAIAVKKGAPKPDISN
ncbi:MAG TPA: substrate-binding domain-containing protein, partial [Micropepsaceae bacterium]|nr:substrate-binding domain-containing protein [Micropepsaceae bacterium]